MSGKIHRCAILKRWIMNPDEQLFDLFVLGKETLTGLAKSVNAETLYEPGRLPICTSVVSCVQLVPLIRGQWSGCLKVAVSPHPQPACQFHDWMLLANIQGWPLK
jgi:hypothetical protein